MTILIFFESYAQMERSQDLESAGEWHQLQPLLEKCTLAGKRVLDLGCGYGWHCRYATQQKASEILGIDLSHRMLEQAGSMTNDKRISYRQMNLEDYEYPADRWDVVISNLALHYIQDLDFIFHQVFKTLEPGGVFIFNIEHPIFTSGVYQEWIYSSSPEPLYWPVDNYYHPGPRQTRCLGHEIRKYHYTLTQILMSLLNTGFELQAVVEVEPSKKMLEIEGMENELRRPMVLLVQAAKKTDL